MAMGKNNPPAEVAAVLGEARRSPLVHSIAELVDLTSGGPGRSSNAASMAEASKTTKHSSVPDNCE